MKKNESVTNSKNNVKKRTIKPIVLIIAVILVVLLVILAVKILGGKKSTNNGEVISNNRVSEPGVVKEHDPTNGMHTGRIMKLLAGGEDCYAIEEFAKDHKVLANDISVYRAYYAALEDSFYNSSKKEISLKEFQEAVYKIFGKDYDFNPEIIEYNKYCAPYKYDYSSKKFVKQKSSCKLSCGVSTTLYDVVKVTEEYGKYTIDVKVLFGAREGDVAFYSDPDRTNLVTNSFSEAATSKEKGTTYRFIFESEGSEYTFVSSEPVFE